jgi:hypothetical protein
LSGSFAGNNYIKQEEGAFENFHRANCLIKIAGINPAFNGIKPTLSKKNFKKNNSENA